MSSTLARRIGAWIGAVALGVGGIAGAQSTQADFIVNSAATLLRIDRTTMAITSFASPGAVVNRQIWTFPERLDTYSLDLATPTVLHRVTPTGVVSTVATYPNGLSWVGHGDYDHDGAFVTYTGAGVVRFDRQGVLTTVFATPNAVAVTFDGDSGDLILFEPLQILRLSAGGAVTTVRMTSSFLGVATFVPSLGGYLAVNNNLSLASTYSWFDQWGNAWNSFVGPGPAYAIRPSSTSGHVLVSSLTGIVEVSLSGSIARAWPFMREHGTIIRSMTITGRNRTFGIGTPTPGATYAVSALLPNSVGRPYVAAMSLAGLRPGIPVAGGRTVDLAIDPLAALSLQLGDLPGITRGLTGTIAASGRNTITIALPVWLPRGTRIFTAVVAFNPSLPGSIDVAPTHAFTVR